VSKQSKADKDFIATARKRFQQAADDEKLIRDEALIDLKYVAGDQWDPKLKQDRERAGRPALTFPRCHTFVQQVSNEARQNKPQIKFAKGDAQADDDTAEIYEGLARHIQYSSDAQVAYETAVEYSAGGSFGYYRFLTEENSDGYQEICIKPVLDPFSVYGILNPYCFNREPRFGFVIEDMPREEFEEQHPDSAISKDAGFDEGGIRAGWIGTETVRVAEYWYCTGKGDDQKVKFCKMTWAEKLPDTETEWLGYCIPIIPVTGKQIIIEGKAQLFSIVRYQRGAQQMINYAKSRIAETLSTSPISPYMVAQGQIDKGDKKWENLNTQVFPYLEYKSVDVTGRPAPPPQRQAVEPPIVAYSSFVAQEIDDMKATSGIFDASLGNKGNETSGSAIARRQQQANMTTMHFMDNLERAFKKGGVILEDLFPKVYDDDRIIQILGADEKPKYARINAMHRDENGKARHYKIGGKGAGKYNVVVTMGRAFSTKRQESFDMLQQLTQSAPNLLPMFGDIMFQNSDVAGSDVVAERFKKMLPPNLQGGEEGDPQQQLQQMQGQFQQLQQAHQALNAYAQKLEKEKEGKLIENQTKAQIAQMQEMSRQSIAQMQETTKLSVAQINASKDSAQSFAEAEIERYKLLQTHAHEVGMQAQEHGHAQDMAEQQAQNAAVQSAQDHAQGLEAAAQQQPADSGGEANA